MAINHNGSVFYHLGLNSLTQYLTLDTLFSYSKYVLTDRNTDSYGFRLGVYYEARSEFRLNEAMVLVGVKVSF